MSQTIITVPKNEGFDPTDIEITDGVDDAFLIRDTGGNEWFKIDTRNGTGENCINMAYGAGQKVLIGIANSAAQGPFSPLQVTNSQNSSYAVRFYGDTTYQVDNQFAWGRDNQTSVWIHPLGGRFDSSSSSGSFNFRNSSSHTMMTMDDDSNLTYVIDYDAAAENKFVVGTNRTGGSANLMSISSRNTGLGGIEGVFFAGPVTSQVWVSGPSTFRVQSAELLHNPSSGKNFTTQLQGTSAFQVKQTSGDSIMNIDADSNTTFTLEDASSAVFKVQDDAGTPTEYVHINTTSGSEKTTFLVPKTASNDQIVFGSPAHQYLKLGHHSSSATGASFAFVSQGGTNVNFGYNAHDSGGIEFKTAANRHCDVRLESGASFHVKSPNDNVFTVDQDSSLTHTLDDASGATFTVTDNNATPKVHLRCTQSALTKPQIEVNGLQVFSGNQLTLSSTTYGTHFQGGIMQSRIAASLGATTATRLIDIGVVNMENYAQILTATPSTTGQTFTLDFNDTGTTLSNLPVALYKFVLKNAGTESCTFTAASTMAGGGRVKGVDISGASIGVLDSSSGSITAAAGDIIYVEITNHVSDSTGGVSNRFIICKTICKI